MKRLADAIEAILLVAGRPLTLNELAQAANCEPAAAETALKQIEQRLKGGVRLSCYGQSYELVSDPDLAEIITPFIAAERQRPLSPPALETLAIVLYRQPVTKLEIEEIRGVASDQIINNLLNRQLIEEGGSKPEPGRPMTYRPSPQALRQLGVTDTNKLPPLKEANNEA